MKARSSLVLLLAAVQCITVVVARSDVFCLTKNDCKQRQEVLGFETFKSGGKYGKIGRGCFSKDNTLYYSGGSYAQKTTLDMGSSDAKRVTCGGTDKVSTVVTTSEPTNKPTHKPTSEPTLEPTKNPTPEPTAEPTVITDAPTDAETETETEEPIEPIIEVLFRSDDDTIDTDEDQSGSDAGGALATEMKNELVVTSNSTPVGIELSSNNYTEYQNATLNDDEDEVSDLVESFNNTSNETETAGVDDHVVEEKEAYLPKSYQKNSFLEIGAAGAAAGILLIALFIHRRKKRSRLQVQDSNNEAIDDEAMEPPVQAYGPYDVEKAIEVFEAASTKVDGFGCWAPAEYAGSSSFEGSSDLLWASSASDYEYESSLDTAKESAKDEIALTLLRGL